MTRKQIKIISLQAPNADTPEPTPAHPEADGMSEVLSEMKDEAPAPTEEQQEPAAPVEPVAAVEKPKAKRKPRAKKAEAAPVEVMPTVVEEPAAETPPPPEPVEEPKAKAEKVPCPDCGRMVSEKTLKYTHSKTCKAKNPKHIVIGENDLNGPPDVDDQESTTEHHKHPFEYVLEKLVEEELHKRTVGARQAKVAKRTEKIAKLAAAAF